MAVWLILNEIRKSKMEIPYKIGFVLALAGSQGRSPRRVQEDLLPPIHPRIPPTSPNRDRVGAL